MTYIRINEAEGSKWRAWQFWTGTQPWLQPADWGGGAHLLWLAYSSSI